MFPCSYCLERPCSPQPHGPPPSCRTAAAQLPCPSPASSERLSASPGLSGTPPSYSAAPASPPPAPCVASGSLPPAVVGRRINGFIDMLLVTPSFCKWILQICRF